ncbi:pseudouridylate synthase-like protein [Ilyobacter polytropus DSM 2926]|uniref:Pseudouridylate synthase-like protein n=2 Tax=Ilyobacter TaxID=167639 RepID=E3H8R6_ILYPC|nr:pseudouridylate synthase-like protein [Ilyobacter polytropus DSM 2926]
MNMENKLINLRKLEKSKKFGYLFYISYRGGSFDSFDEVKNKKSVKERFREIMNSIGFTWAKGIQQAGRTDAKVSAGENILYVSSSYSGDMEEIEARFNEISKKEMKIKKIQKTLSDLVIPDLVEAREYCYRYPAAKIKNNEEKIESLCRELSGTYDVSEFTDFKGQKLKEKIRSVEISFKDKGLWFKGSSFMPKQVRIMSGYILTGEKTPLPGKYLNLEKIFLKKNLEDMFIEKALEIQEENLLYAEKMGNLYIFYVKSSKKGEFIGTKGKNIKNLRKKYGNIVVREIADVL